MTGAIKYKYPLFFTEDIPQQDLNTKYRIIGVYSSDRHDNKYRIVGFLEPINYFNRCQGAIQPLALTLFRTPLSQTWERGIR